MKEFYLRADWIENKTFPLECLMAEETSGTISLSTDRKKSL